MSMSAIAIYTVAPFSIRFSASDAVVATYELVQEFRRTWPQYADHMAERVESFARLDPIVLRDLNADRIPKPPLTLVRPNSRAPRDCWKSAPEAQRVCRPHHVSEVLPLIVARNSPTGDEVG